MASKRDYYEVLGVQKGATQDQIKDAYRRLAMQYHPDRNKEPGAEEKFKELSEAYAVLSDPEKKERYDNLGQAGFNQQYSQEDIFRGADFESIFRDFGIGGIGDIFNFFFGGGRGYGGRVSRGNDILQEVEITLEEAARGADKEIEVQRTERCDVCGGSGANPGTTPKTCPRCNGAGQVQKVVSSAFGRFATISPCPNCRGSGTVIESPCRACRGTGLMKKNRRILVRIPPGVDDGSQLRMREEGSISANNGPPGDLYVQIRTIPHPNFKREGFNIIYDLAVGFPQASLGTELNVPTLDGNVLLTIKPGTQSGTILRIRGKGLPKLGGFGRGDELIRVNVTVPDKLTQRQKELLTELAKEFGQQVKPERWFKF